MDSLLFPSVPSSPFSSHLTYEAPARALCHPSTGCALFCGFCSSRVSRGLMAVAVSRMPASPSGSSLMKNQVTSRKAVSSRMPIPARDRIIDFGKYKGRMLGSLPSKYLYWVTKNLRARDFEEWAKFADEVLDDPVYRDRLEWEFAERVLSGSDHRDVQTVSAVSELLDVSERFGWDNEDKAAWRRINFELLGTSIGGRIPRKDSTADRALPSVGRKNESSGNVHNISSSYGKKQRPQGKRMTTKEVEGFTDAFRERRQQRREKQNIRRHQQFGILDSGAEDVEDVKEKVMVKKQNDRSDVGSTFNPFPGRDGILKKMYR